MDEKQKKILRNNHVTLVNNLEPRGKVLDSLYEDGVLTENDLEHISSATTRKERCQLLLSVLPTRGPVAYGSFRKALGTGQYDYLIEKLRGVSIGTGNSQCVNERTQPYNARCTECEAFYATVCSRVGVTVKDTQFARVVKNNLCLVLDNVEPKDVIDQLYQDHAITADDCEKIKHDITRRQRCQTLVLQLLKRQTENSVKSLTLALLRKYQYIVDAIEAGQRSRVRAKPSRPSNEPLGVQVLQKARKLNDDSDTENRPIPTNSQKNKNKREGLQLLQKTLKLDSEHEADEGFDEAGTALVDITNIKARNCKTTVKSVFSDEENSVDKFDDVDGGFHDNRIDWLQNNDVDLGPEDAACDSVQQIGLCDQHTDISTKANQTVCVVNEQSCGGNDVTITENPQVSRMLIVSKQMAEFPSERPCKRLSVAFNYLSTLINQGDFEKFENISSGLKQRFPYNYDMMCIIGYLHASRDLFRTDFDSAKRHINATMELVPKTSNPRYFTLELYTAKTRMYVTQKKLEKLQTALDEAIMILETDPVGCTGRAAGWLYINNARNKTAQLSCLNLSKPNALQTYNHLFDCAKSSFQRSMTNFKKDGGKDGPFGFGYALCRLVILLLRCGDNGLTMDVMRPSDDDVKSAGQYIQHLEDSDITISKIMDMHFRLAKCDYQFRRENMVRALEHAQIAYEIANDLNMLEFKEHAYNRLTFVRSKATFVDKDTEITEDEAHQILFGDSSDNDGSDFGRQSD